MVARLCTRVHIMKRVLEQSLHDTLALYPTAAGKTPISLVTRAVHRPVTDTLCVANERWPCRTMSQRAGCRPSLVSAGCARVSVKSSFGCQCSRGSLHTAVRWPRRVAVLRELSMWWLRC